MTETIQNLSLKVSESTTVSAQWMCPSQTASCFVFAHGAGAGMTHAFIEKFSTALAERRIATLRYQFPYMERGSRRPDPPALCHATVRAAVALAGTLTKVPMIAGGRSFGGRMTSQAQAERPLDLVRGLAFLGFPLHPPKSVSDERGRHLSDIQIPMLFLQGTRDELADLGRLELLVDRLGKRATLKLSEHANHAFHVPARSGRTDAQVFQEIVESFTEWTLELTT